MTDNSHSNFKLKRHKMYPRVKVRVQEEEEEDHFPPHTKNNHHEPSLFLRLLESLSKQEKENKINSPTSNSISCITKAYITSPTPKDGGTVKKNKKQKDMKSNVKASSVLPPRAVLSSPDNDRMMGSINKLDYARSSSASKRSPAEVGNQSQNVTPSSPNIGKGPKPKAENVKHTPSVARTKIITKGGYNTDIVKSTPGPKAKNPGLSASTRKGVL